MIRRYSEIACQNCDFDNPAFPIVFWFTFILAVIATILEIIDMKKGNKDE